MDFVKIYPFQVEKTVKEGKTVFVLDRKYGKVYNIKEMSYEYAIKATSSEDKTDRFDFWYEEKETEEEDGEL